MSPLVGYSRRVLLVEDDATLAQSTRRGLVTDGWDVELRCSGEEALEAVAASSFDLVILDVGLPGMDGFAVCQKLRATGGPPVVMLTARDDVADRVKGLEFGAEDYIVKPFAISELIARSNAVLRRGHIRAGQDLRAGALRMDLAARRAWRDNELLALTPSEWSALECLVPRLDRLVSRDDLQEAIADGGSWLTDNALEAHVSRLRTKLRGTGLALRSVRGIGYILEVEREPVVRG
ncbi:MAG TPA: response regulator transcription factor [Burkholderiaceae bacterium]|nr:response regulator transcription factor [Burkholderiaceae bacterium]HQR71867.1 response regulator transcription factor [Burkholderiaceae bacterium]